MFLIAMNFYTLTMHKHVERFHFYHVVRSENVVHY